jgi:hypothetical protein
LDRFEKRCQEAHVLCIRKNREGKNFVEILKEIEQGAGDKGYPFYRKGI